MRRCSDVGGKLLDTVDTVSGATESEVDELAQQARADRDRIAGAEARVE